MGSVLTLTGKIKKMAKFGSVWINVETGDGHEYLLSIGYRFSYSKS